MAVSLDTQIWMTFGVLLTLFTFSFLYKDNPLYKIAEHLVVGVSAGYWIILLYHNGLRQNLLDNLFKPGTWSLNDPWYSGIHYLIPAFLGIAMWMRFSRKYSWISRYPLAFYLGIANGVAIPISMKNYVVMQMKATTLTLGFDWSTGGFLGVPLGVWDVVIVIGTISSLVYFFFSKEHKGAFGGVARIGIYTLMIGFGASFGYTVMARISLFIQRIQYIRDWLSIVS